ncbi:hypothetical protein LUZ61_006364 [Rhynchospora tenuis]|uniref:soluble epoxide hydrolase n=1 Tax=Rhynchospora tenuis TaxID=198213 RepID=A0AAD5ZRN6_9POAL|nr:hypothetical protein LUZ61_006364 [Rhynchospora tenuis]
MEADGISHRTIEVNGIAMHVADKGPVDAPVVLFVHGFPELWYSWRHQILSLSGRGYRCIAPDMRGFGQTTAPPSASSYSILHLIGDLIALLDALSLQQVFLVGLDWGARVAWNLCMLTPDRVKALVTMSAAFKARNPAIKPIEQFRSLYGDEYYICRFQDPGVAEKEFALVSTKNLFKKLFAGKSTGSSAVSKEFISSATEETPLPPWITEEDIEYYASSFDKSGFTGPMNYYCCLDLNWELLAPWTGAQVKVPTKFIVGEFDLTYHHPGIKDYLHKGGLKQDVPLLEEVVVVQGAGHFIQQENEQEISDHIYNFFTKF